MSTEDVEEIVVEVKDKQIEPAEGVQQPMEEQEVMIQEAPPEPRQPEQTTSLGELAFREWMRKMMESLQEGLNSTKADLNSKIEEGLNSTKADLNRIEEGQRSTCLLYTSRCV